MVLTRARCTGSQINSEVLIKGLKASIFEGHDAESGSIPTPKALSMICSRSVKVSLISVLQYLARYCFVSCVLRTTNRLRRDGTTLAFDKK